MNDTKNNWDNSSRLKCLEEWKRKRKRTTLLAMIHVFLYGLEYAAISVSLLFYLQGMVKCDHPKLWYGVIMSALFLSAIVTGVVIGKYIDRTRNVRKAIILTVLLNVVGNLLYTMHYSKWYLVIGRFMCGFTDATQPVMTGEFTRCYTKDELVSVLSHYQILFSIGFVIGPCTPALFGAIDFSIGSWHINQYNCIGLFLAAAMFIYGIISYFWLSDISKEQPNFENTYNDNKQVTDIMPLPTHKNQIDYSSEVPVNYLFTFGSIRHVDHLLTAKDLFNNIDILLVILSSSYLNFNALTIELSLNMIAISVFNWSLTHLAVVTFVGVILYSIVMFLCEKHITGKLTLFFIYIWCLVACWLAMTILLFSYSADVTGTIQQTLLIGITIVINCFYGFTAVTISRDFLFSLTPSHSGSFAEGYRNAVSRVFTFVAVFTVGFIYAYKQIAFPIFILLIFLMMLCLLLRRHVYIKKYY